MISTSFVISCLIFFLIAIREWLPSAVRIWHIMVAGAVVLLLLGEISPRAALEAIDWNVIAYLFGVFAIAAALYDSGISHAIGDRIAALQSPSVALAALIIAITLCAAVLTNDAAAVIGTPIVLMLARSLRLPPIPLLVALCATVTVGSMASPVGNPQNILIATNGQFDNPVATFGLWLIVPTVVSLAFVFCWSRFLIKRPMQVTQLNTNTLPDPADNARIWPAYLGLAVLVLLIGVDSVLQGLGDGLRLPYGISSLIACSPIFVAGNRRTQTFKEVDWPTLAFFVAMFVVTGSLLQSGSLQTMLGTMQISQRASRHRADQLLGEPAFLERSRRRHVPQAHAARRKSHADDVGRIVDTGGQSLRHQRREQRHRRAAGGALRPDAIHLLAVHVFRASDHARVRRRHLRLDRLDGRTSLRRRRTLRAGVS